MCRIISVQSENDPMISFVRIRRKFNFNALKIIVYLHNSSCLFALPAFLEGFYYVIMTIFYNVIGLVNLINAIMMLRCGAMANESRQEFRLASRVLHVVFLLTSASMFSAQFEQRLEYGEFQLLNPLMLLFFYTIAQGIIYTLLILFKAKYASQYIKHTSIVFFLFSLYTILYFIFDDRFLYTFDDLFASLPRSPMLMFRCVLLISILISIGYGIIVYHRACRENNKRIADSFSELEFQRGMVISRFMWSVKALAIWSLLTYVYTTPTIEVVSCSLITIVFIMQLIGFRDYLSSSNAKMLRVLTTSGEINLEVDEQEIELKQKLQSWIKREDKPYTQSGITITDVAKEIGVPKNRLSIYINGTDMTFRSWLNDLRIEESKRLLMTEDEKSISEIALDTGFCDLPAFSRAFKKATGLTPKSFRCEQKIACMED